MLHTVILALLIVEGVGVCMGAVAGVVSILRSLMRHRAALFSVFLALPNTAIRTLANKSTNIGDEEEDSDDGAQAGGCTTALEMHWQALAHAGTLVSGAKPGAASLRSCTSDACCPPPATHEPQRMPKQQRRMQRTGNVRHSRQQRMMRSATRTIALQRLAPGAVLAPHGAVSALLAMVPAQAEPLRAPMW